MAVMLTRLCLGQLELLRRLGFWELPEARPLLLAIGAEVTEAGGLGGLPSGKLT